MHASQAVINSSSVSLIFNEIQYNLKEYNVQTSHMIQARELRTVIAYYVETPLGEPNFRK
jgi:hypothetical protein